MQSQNLGFGIAGKKNTYSSRILLDNWVEDSFGVDMLTLTQQGRIKRVLENHYTSTQRASHIDPALMSYHPNILKVKLESAEDLMTRNKEGMPYDLLFSYSNNKDNRFETSMQNVQKNANPNQYDKYAKVDGTLSGEREKNVRRELRALQSLRSESKLSTRRIDISSSGLKKAQTDTHTPLPNFSKTLSLSGFYNDANIPIVNNLRKA